MRSFARGLMDQASRDLGARLDWVAVDHWNTGHPHIHILVRGRGEVGTDLVISRGYIGTGFRARADDLVELGLRSELEVRRGLKAEVTVELWTTWTGRWPGKREKRKVWWIFDRERTAGTIRCGKPKSCAGPLS